MFKLTYLKLYYQDFLEDGTYIIRYHCFVFYQKSFQHFLILLASFNFFKKNSRSFSVRLLYLITDINDSPTSNAPRCLKLKYFLSTFILFLLVLMSINKVSALTAITAKEITGSLPYITYDGGQTKITKLSSLLVMRNPDGRTFIPENDVTILFPNSIVDSSNPRNPIEVPAGSRWQDIGTFVPLGSGDGYNPSIDLNSLLGLNHNWQDLDGDNNFYVSGNLTLIIQSSSGADISNWVKTHQDWEVYPCDAPYRLTISVTNSDFSTQYGIPRIGFTNGSSHTYYLRPKITTPYVCFARPPNITNDSTSGSGYPDLDSSQWVAGQGFKPQDIYYPPKNFPTLAADNLSFDLVIAGLTAQQVIDGYSDGIVPVAGFDDGRPKQGEYVCRISPTCGDDKKVETIYIKLSIAPNQDVNTGNKLRLTFFGPNFNHIAFPTHYALPTFYIDYKATGTRLYSFSIYRWFILVPRGQNKTCTQFSKKGLNWVIPDISFFTNANGYTWNNGISGRNINNYRRQISTYSSFWDKIEFQVGKKKRIYDRVRLATKNGGLFSEWGYMFEGAYPGTDWSNGDYLTSNTYANNQNYYVSSYDGSIIKVNDHPNAQKRLVCIQPTYYLEH